MAKLQGDGIGTVEMCAVERRTDRRSNFSDRWRKIADARRTWMGSDGNKVEAADLKKKPVSIGVRDALSSKNPGGLMTQECPYHEKSRRVNE